MSPEPLAAVDRADVRERVGLALQAFLAAQADRLAAVGPELVPVADALSSFLLDGGKRLRPAFAYWAYRGAGGEDDDAVVRAVASLELLQACALVHDDVMDGSDTRRGQPAVHRRFAALHRDSGWTGDAEGFGVAAAILLGDLCHVWADECLDTSGMAQEALRRARPVWDRLRSELMAGQYLDVVQQASAATSVESALRVARWKSARYTVEGPLHLGAALAGAGGDVVAACTAYGLPLGEAFQLRDDVLGVFGDPSETGKPAGDDLREGKRTALVAMALERATPEQAAAVERHLGDPGLDDAGVELLRDVIRDTGALARTEALVEQLAARAAEALTTAPLADEAREVLGDLAVAAVRRRT